MGAAVIANLGGSSRQAGSARPLDVTILDASGNPIVSFGGAGGTASNFGDPFPTPGTAIGFKDSTGALMAPGNLDASGNLRIAGSFSATPTTATTSTLTNTNDSASSVTVLAANALRLAFMLYNDSDQICSVKLGTTASLTSFTKRLLPQESWSTADLGVNYTGKIDAIWDADSTGAMRATELTA